MTFLRCSLCCSLGRSLRSACLAAGLAACSLAQAPSPAAKLPPEKTVRSWLLSEEPRLVAWGAHYALVERNRRLIPDLLNLASRWQPLSQRASQGSSQRTSQQTSGGLDGSFNIEGQSSEETDERDAMAAVVDALIQMKAPVPADTLRGLAPDFGNEVAVLLSRMPAEEAAPLRFELYRLPGPNTDGLQYVSASLLALHPAPGFAADLLTHLYVRATVYAVLPGAPEFGSGVAGDCFSEYQAPRKDWPVTGQYGLSQHKGDGATLLVAGIDPIYATREQSTHYLGGSCRIPGVHLGPEQRRRLIAEMLSTSPDEIPWQTSLETRIEFQSLPQFDSALMAFVEEQQRKFRTTTAELVADDLLTPAEAEQSLPQLELTLNDRRGAEAVPIPDLTDLPPHVKWASSPFH
jgi:hypothetical protein